MARKEKRTAMIHFSFKSVSVGLVTLTCLLAAPASADSITYEVVTVGDPGNANDTGGSGIGSVGYSYQIGTYDVTIGQYTAFLNAVDPDGTNPNGIYNPSMGTDPNISGISFNPGASSGSKYSVMTVSGIAPSGGVSNANRPITYVSWFDAARFANWMTNGQGSGSTETGAYDLVAAPAGTAPPKSPGATFYIPNENEWYKAAYYSPNYGGVGVPGYYEYATQSDSDPGGSIGSAANQANYVTGIGYSVTQNSNYDPNQNYLTDVGAFTNSSSFYGTFDQSGNVFQWNDLDGTAGSLRGIRGGHWNDTTPFFSSSSAAGSIDPSNDGSSLGFRLATVVPEPSTYIVAFAGLACGGLHVFRRRRAR
jgi:formylglycine-generating enzyme required for sulfatase activity